MKKKNLIDQLKSLKHGQQFLAIVILFLVLSVAWIFLSIFAGHQESKISPALQKAAQPLTPQIDEATLEKIEAKHYYTHDELGSFPIFKVITTNRGKEQTIVPITYDETGRQKKKPSGSLESILDAPNDESKTKPTTTSPSPSTTTESAPNPSAEPTLAPVSSEAPAL